MPSRQYLHSFGQPEKVESDFATHSDFVNPSALPGNAFEHHEHPHCNYIDDVNNTSKDPANDTAPYISKEIADEHFGRSTPTSPPVFDYDTAHSESSDNPSAVNVSFGNQVDIQAVPALMNSKSLDQEQKLDILNDIPEHDLNRLYDQHMDAYGLPKPSMTYTVPSNTETLNEDNYMPLDPYDEPSPDPQARRPLYPMYGGHFQTAQAAKTHRKRTRVAPKSNAPDVERVKRYGRQYWVRKIYEAMIDIEDISDGQSSIHRQRFAEVTAFDPLDLEASAHQVFDSALAVHERGWNRPVVYHKKVVRGKLTDVSEHSLEKRLTRICLCFKQKKATVDDAIRGGVTLALLCDNPEARGFTKSSNNLGNKKRGERLRLAKGAEAQQEVDEEDEAE